MEAYEMFYFQPPQGASAAASRSRGVMDIPRYPDLKQLFVSLEARSSPAPFTEELWPPCRLSRVVAVGIHLL
jgi:hypothetical protein